MGSNPSTESNIKQLMESNKYYANAMHEKKATIESREPKDLNSCSTNESDQLNNSGHGVCEYMGATHSSRHTAPDAEHSSTCCCPTHEMCELSTPLIVANRSRQGDEVYGSYPLVLKTSILVRTVELSVQGAGGRGRVRLISKGIETAPAVRHAHPLTHGPNIPTLTHIIGKQTPTQRDMGSNPSTESNIKQLMESNKYYANAMHEKKATIESREPKDLNSCSTNESDQLNNSGHGVCEYMGATHSSRDTAPDAEYSSTCCCPTHEMWELLTPLIVANRSRQGDEVYGSYPLVLKTSILITIQQKQAITSPKHKQQQA
ncbi:hypothetical protein F511_34024 [Dorcoceras hygrometricum]|uniref:Uncharacterized protein n=1 Tax=Dorcoceras hygrometricum TaxID=472368 RepID=A0A2Z7AW44_9LAMI|nr:hypothetical protein F511_34024 [Dorcoceras hygrometricum]